MVSNGLFRTAPAEVVDYFDRRPSRPSFNWGEVAPREHALGFTAARTAGFDVLDDIRAATRKAVVDRLPWTEFRKELEPVLRAKGWWGRKEVADPRTGEIVKAQLGSTARLNLIYDANVRSAEAAGDWIRIQRVKDVLPYLEYLTSTSERKRPLHLSWVGTTLLVDDAWWATHYPPNGWRCKCRVRSRAMPREGASTERPPLDARPWRNKATGETRMVPAGVDPGWDNNPGMAREQMTGRRLTDRLDAMTAPVRRQAIAAMREDPVLPYIVANGARYDPDPAKIADHAIRNLRWPLAAVPDVIAARLGATTRTASLTVATAEKQLRSRANQPLTVADYDKVQAILDAPEAEAEDKQGLALWRRFDGQAWKVVLKLTAADEIFVTSLRPDAEDQIGRVAVRRRKEKTRPEGR